MDEGNLKLFFNELAKNRDDWLRKNRYYHRQLKKFYGFHIPPGSDILEIGCGTGDLLNSLNASKAVGVDFSEDMVSLGRDKHPNIRFIQGNAVDINIHQKFDYIILSDTLGYVEDIQKVLMNLSSACKRETRIIINIHSPLWEPALRLLEVLGLKMRSPYLNWLELEDLENLFRLSGYDIISRGRNILIPKGIPLLSDFINRYIARLPIIRNLCLTQHIIARPAPTRFERRDLSVSIVVAARNELGNVERIVEELPQLGISTEIVFVEGGSSDGTYEKIVEVAERRKDKRIIHMVQDGIGKGDAVRKGFQHSTGDILMIYDADMTVPSKDLEKFYNEIVFGEGEFINGTRLVYPMDSNAMRSLNLFGNRMFSFFFSWLLEQRITDTLCGTKVIRRSDYERLKRNRTYFGEFDPFGDFDLIFGAAKLDLKIVDIPIRYCSRTYGSTNISRFSHGALLIKMCLFAMLKMRFI